MFCHSKRVDQQFFPLSAGRTGRIYTNAGTELRGKGHPAGGLDAGATAGAAGSSSARRARRWKAYLGPPEAGSGSSASGRHGRARRVTPSRIGTRRYSFRTG